MDANKKVEHLDPRLRYSDLFARKGFVIEKVTNIDTPAYLFSYLVFAEIFFAQIL